MVEADIRNTGKVAGAEVAQLYLGLPSSASIPQPPKQLKGFEKVVLRPGASTHVRFSVDARALSYWSTETHGWKIAPGDYKVFVGSSSRDIRLQNVFQVQ